MFASNRAQRLNRAEWQLLLVLGAVQFTHLVDFMIMLPLGPQFIRVLSISPQKYGFLVSAYGFSASLSSLLAARFVDRFDRKRAMLVLYSGFTLGTLLCAFAANYWVLMVARIIAGGFGGVVAALVLAIVGDAFAYSRRGTAMGVVMSAFSIALITGVPLGLYLANEFGWAAPFAVLGALSVIVLVAAIFILPPLDGHLDAPIIGPEEGIWHVFFNPNHLRAYVLMISLVLGVFMLVPYIPIYLVGNVGRTKEELPYVYLFGGLTTLLTLSIFGRLSDRYGKLLVFRIMALFTIVPIVILTNLPPVPLFVAIAVTTLFMVTTSGRMVPAQALITASASPRYRGSFMSVTASVQQMASALAAIVGGLILGAPAGSAEGADAMVEGQLAPITGYAWVGLVSVAFTVLSVILAGQLRTTEGGLQAVDPPMPEPRDAHIEPAALAS